MWLSVACALAFSPQALAGIAEMRDAQGHLVANAGPGSFASLHDGGWALRFDSATRSTRGVSLVGVSLAGGLVYADRIVVPAHGLRGARIEGLTVNGRAVTARPNTLVPLGPGSYLVVLQEAVVPGEGSGVVGLRLVAGDSSLGIDPGSQLLVGLARAAMPPSQHRTAARLSWLALGVAGRGLDTGGGDRWIPESLLLGVPTGGTTGAEAVRIAMQLQPGDLLFFEPTARGPQHEGIYIGGGQFVHAPHTGDVVKISSLAEPGYAFGFVGAVRPWG